MIAALALVLAVTLLPPADRSSDANAAKARAAFVSEADEGNVAPAAGRKEEKPKELRIRSRRSDFDRLEGVAMFEDHVVVEYDADFTLTSDRLFAFLVSSNRLDRIVATGHVTITNESRVGGAAMATFTKSVNVVNLYGDGKGPAWLRDRPNEVAGSRIRFKLDSEEVEVTRPIFSVENKGQPRDLVK